MQRAHVQTHRAGRVLGRCNRRLAGHTVLFRLRVLHADRYAEQLLARQPQRQRDRLGILKLNVGDTLEALRFVACDQTDVAHLAYAREELFQVARMDALGQLHAKDGTRIPILLAHLFQRGSITVVAGATSSPSPVRFGGHRATATAHAPSTVPRAAATAIVSFARPASMINAITRSTLLNHYLPPMVIALAAVLFLRAVLRTVAARWRTGLAAILAATALLVAGTAGRTGTMLFGGLFTVPIAFTVTLTLAVTVALTITVPLTFSFAFARTTAVAVGKFKTN